MDKLTTFNRTRVCFWFFARQRGRLVSSPISH